MLVKLVKRPYDQGETQNNSSGGSSTKPLAWVILPLVVVFTVLMTGLILYRRRRRRLNPERYGNSLIFRDRVLTPGGHLVSTTAGRRNRHGRWTPWTGTRSAEGLNELGEAPPPYKHSDEGDLESGSHQPPQYNLPREPDTAVVRDGDNRRSSEASGSGTGQHTAREYGQDGQDGDTYEMSVRGLHEVEHQQEQQQGQGHGQGRGDSQAQSQSPDLATAHGMASEERGTEDAVTGVESRRSSLQQSSSRS